MYDFFQRAPRVAEVYNIGVERKIHVQFLESFNMVEKITGKAMKWIYKDDNRVGDHICYYSDLRKMRTHYPMWHVSKKLNHIFEQIAEKWMSHSSPAAH